MNTLVATPTTVVRLWDSEWTPMFTLDNLGWRIDEPDLVVVPFDSPVARWLMDDEYRQFRAPVYLTADHDGDRWYGQLETFEVVKVEGFSRKYLRARFRDGQRVEQYLADIRAQMQRNAEDPDAR